MGDVLHPDGRLLAHRAVKRGGPLRRTPLARSSLRPKPRSNRMTTPSHDAVLALDRECVAVLLGATDVCRDRWGTPHVSWEASRLTVDHVKAAPMMGQSEDRDDRTQAVSLCWHHHLDGWATASRPLLRAYLRLRQSHHPVEAARLAREEVPE